MTLHLSVFLDLGMEDTFNIICYNISLYVDTFFIKSLRQMCGTLTWKILRHVKKRRFQPINLRQFSQSLNYSAQLTCWPSRPTPLGDDYTQGLGPGTGNNTDFVITTIYSLIDLKQNTIKANISFKWFKFWNIKKRG